MYKIVDSIAQSAIFRPSFNFISITYIHVFSFYRWSPAPSREQSDTGVRTLVGGRQILIFADRRQRQVFFFSYRTKFSMNVLVSLRVLFFFFCIFVVSFITFLVVFIAFRYAMFDVVFFFPVVKYTVLLYIQQLIRRHIVCCSNNRLNGTTCSTKAAIVRIKHTLHIQFRAYTNNRWKNFRNRIFVPEITPPPPQIKTQKEIARTFILSRKIWLVV